MDAASKHYSHVHISASFGQFKEYDGDYLTQVRVYFSIAFEQYLDVYLQPDCNFSADRGR